MPRGTKKSDLPQKTCATCGRPFAWRRKWAAVWDEVRYCSDRCRAARRNAPSVSTGTADVPSRGGEKRSSTRR